MVVGIAVHVEQVLAGSPPDVPDELQVPSLADVDDALEHLGSLARRAARDAARAGALYGGSVNLGATELLIVLLVILVLFGGTKLPKLARSLGQAQNEFKKGVRDDVADDPDGEKPSA